MKRVNTTKSDGFTLIELLVVIAIIALLSSLIFGALDDARGKARNAKKEELVRQYMTALELYRDKYGTYPIYDVDETTWACVGFVTGDTECLGGTNNTDSGVNTAFAEFIPGPPKADDPLSIGPLDLAGIRYHRYERIDMTFKGYTLRYYLENTKKCNVGETLIFGDHSRCTVSIFNDD